MQTGSDNLSRSLIRFKKALADDLQAWIDCAVKELKSLLFPIDLIILRALSADETIINTNKKTALDKLGKAISNDLSTTWMTDLIMKKKPTRPLKTLSAIERKNELENIYTLKKKLSISHPEKFLLIDDIVTTGTTMQAIANLLRFHFPDTDIFVFTLAKTTHEDESNSSLSLKGNTYNWYHDQANWMIADAEENYVNYHQLVSFILMDKFE